MPKVAEPKSVFLDWDSEDAKESIIRYVKKLKPLSASDIRVIPLYKTDSTCSYRVNIYQSRTDLFRTKTIVDSYFVKTSVGGEVITAEKK